MKKHIIHQWLSRMLRQLIPNIGSILMMAAMLFVYDAHAAGLNASTSPQTINYQGIISTVAGTLINGNIGLTIRIYPTQSGGTPLWMETRTGINAVPVTNGLFEILLGSVTPIPSTVWDNPTLYLSIQVEGDSTELLPRKVISAVPYAMNVTGTIVIPNNSVTTAMLQDGSVTPQKAPMLLGSLVSNQFIQTGITQTINLQPGWNNPAGITTFPTPFTSVPVVVAIDFSDGMANMPLNIITTGDSSPQRVVWGIYSGHTSGTRQVVLKWIAVGK